MVEECSVGRVSCSGWLVSAQHESSGGYALLLAEGPCSGSILSSMYTTTHLFLARSPIHMSQACQELPGENLWCAERSHIHPMRT